MMYHLHSVAEDSENLKKALFILEPTVRPEVQDFQIIAVVLPGWMQFPILGSYYDHCLQPGQSIAATRDRFDGRSATPKAPMYHYRARLSTGSHADRGSTHRVAKPSARTVSPGVLGMGSWFHAEASLRAWPISAQKVLPGIEVLHVTWKQRNASVARNACSTQAHPLGSTRSFHNYPYALNKRGKRRFSIPRA
jgi:hypothetical protein